METKSEYEICIVGSACVDYFFEVTDFPQRGETIAAKSYFNASGGKGANQAASAARLTGSAIFAGQFGRDDAGRMIERDMKDCGCNMDYIRWLDGVKTAVGFVTLSESGQNSIIIVGGANMHYTELTTLPKEYTDAIDKSKIILLQREIPNEINTLVGKYARSKGKLVVLDVGGRDDPFTEDLLNSVDFVSPNETELERIVGPHLNQQIEITIREKLLSKYPHLKVLLKLGADGCAVVTQDLYIKCSNIATYNKQITEDYKIVDVTGAGDCLMGAFFGRYSQLIGQVNSETLSWEQLYERCMLYGNLCAFLCICTKGCIPAMPDAQAVADFHKKYLASTLI